VPATFVSRAAGRGNEPQPPDTVRSRVRAAEARSAVVIISEFSCQDLVELVTEYLEGTLPADVRSAFDLHIAECPSCHEYLEQIRTTIALTGAIAEQNLSAGARDALIDAFRDWKTRRPSS
jgi:hypothetical protein